jgi:hypothetical protein
MTTDDLFLETISYRMEQSFETLETAKVLADAHLYSQLEKALQSLFDAEEFVTGIVQYLGYSRSC